MPRFCTKCGAPLEEAAAFCSRCGQPVYAARVPPLAAEPPAAPARPRTPLYIALGAAAVFGLLLLIVLLASGDWDDEEYDTGAVAQNMPSRTQNYTPAATPYAPPAQPEPPVYSSGNVNYAATGDDSWAIYWYLCGSDLETRGGAATADLVEMLNTSLPGDVTVVVQTGGSDEWHNEAVDASAAYRLAYTGGGLSVVDTLPSQNMGDPNTLAAFLEFCETNYPAKRTALIFWDHGSGSAGGLCYDEQFLDDALSMRELDLALNWCYGTPAGRKPLDLIGFDACLMASLDIARLCAPYAAYMTASEETEPGCGWQYDALLAALAGDSGMDGAQLGAVICDTYMEGCEAYGVADFTTLSTVDLAKIPGVIDAVDALSTEGVLWANSRGVSEFFAEYGRGAQKAEYYSDKSHGMVDIVSLVRQNAALFPQTGPPVIQSVLDCVVYQRTGEFRRESHGLAAYFPYEYDVDQFEMYARSAASPGLTYLYEMLFSGGISQEAADFFNAEIAGMQGGGQAEAQMQQEEYDLADTSALGLQDYPLTVREQGIWTYAQMSIGGEAASMLQSVAFTLAAFDGGDYFAYVGEDSGVEADWANGVFTDGFSGTWGAIDGHLVSTVVAEDTADYTLYDVPITLNGEFCILSVAYAYSDGSYRILTATPDTEDGVPSKIEYVLRPGDAVTPLFTMVSILGDETVFYEGETFTVTENTAYSEIALPDGYYALSFLMTDYAGEQYMSDAVGVTIEGGHPIIATVEDWIESIR